MSDNHFTPDDLAELRRLARSRPKSGRDWVAKLGALRVIERLEREEAVRRRRDPEHRFPCEHGEDGPKFEVYVWSEVERILFGALAGPEGRPEREQREITAVVDALTAADDSHEAFRRWHTAMEATMRLQDRA